MHRHFMIHKPIGFVSQFIYSHRRKNRLLGELYDFPKGTMAIGRLDANSEGLLLLTTDGKVSEQVRSKKVEKEYYVQVDGEIDEAAIEHLRTGVEIVVKGEKYTTKPCEVRPLIPAPEFPPCAKKIRDDRHGPSSWISITIREGKFRQVRKMTAVAGFPTLRLIRMRIGKLSLGDLPIGGVSEVDHLNLNEEVPTIIDQKELKWTPPTIKERMNYHDRKFKAVSNSENGEVAEGMIFHYQQQYNIVTCEYAGGEIVKGHLIGVVDNDGNIKMRYHQVNKKGHLMTGKCHSKPEIMENGLIRLHEEWEWTSGDESKGSSILEEIED